MNLLLAFILLLQDKRAEETFKKIEETIEKAKGLTVKFTWKPDTVGYGSGTMLLKEGGKANVIFNLKNPGGEYKLFLVSDGSKMTWIMKPPDRTPHKETKATPQDLLSFLGLARFGAAHGISNAGLFEESPDKQPLYEAMRTNYRLSGFKVDEDETEAKVISYKIMLFEAVEAEAMLWYDAATQRPLKRKMHFRNLVSHGGCSSDTFEVFSFDAAILDEKFKLTAIDEMELNEVKIRATGQTISQIANALRAYGRDTGTLPTTEQGLDALLSQPAKGMIPMNWKGPYLKEKSVQMDSWGHPYVYTFPQERNPFGYYLFSVGPDGDPRTNDDIFEN